MEIELALQQALNYKPDQALLWQPLLTRLQAARQVPASLQALLQGLESTIWSDRFLARHQLAASDEETLAWLQQQGSLPQKTIDWLGQSIGHY